MEALGLITALAVIIEALVENFAKEIDARYKVWITAAVGVALCIAYEADVLAFLGYTATFPYIGQILTGFLIGRGSNYINDIITRIRSPKVTAETIEFANVKVEGDDTNVAVDKQPIS
jgi:hypothetical protein